MNEADFQQTITPQAADSKKKLYLGLIIAVIAVVGLVVGVSYFGGGAKDYNKGSEAYDAGDFTTAAEYLRNAAESSGDNPEYYVHLARVEMPSNSFKKDDYPGDWNKAVAYFEKAWELGGLESHPGYRDALQDFGIAYRGAGELDKANEKFLQVIEMYPENAYWSRYFLAEDYFNRLNKPQEALEALKPAPNSVLVNFQHLYWTYIMLARLSSYFENHDDWKKYLELSLENGATDNNNAMNIINAHLAFVAVRDGDFTKAEELAKKSNSDPAYYKCLLAHAYLSVDMPAKANSLAGEVAGGGFRGWCFYALGKANAETGKAAEAKKFYSEYLKVFDTLEQKNIFDHRFAETARGAL